MGDTRRGRSQSSNSDEPRARCARRAAVIQGLDHGSLINTAHCSGLRRPGCVATPHVTRGRRVEVRFLRLRRTSLPSFTRWSRREFPRAHMRFHNGAIVLSLALPGALSAQFAGVSLGRAVSTVDWQYPAPSADCGFCVSDVSPGASRQSSTPALVVQWRTTQWFGGSTEVRLAPKGYALTEPTLRVEYLQVPLMFRLGRVTGRRAGVRPFLEAGPALALRVRCRVFYNGTSDACVQDAVLGQQDWRLRRLDVSGLAGVGLAVHVRRALVLIGKRAEWGWSDMGGPDGVPTKHRADVWYVGGLAAIGPRRQ
jgi:hypothetical protein